MKTNETKFGTFEVNGNTYFLTQEAYPDCCINGDTDFAPGQPLRLGFSNINSIN